MPLLQLSKAVYKFTGMPGAFGYNFPKRLTSYGNLKSRTSQNESNKTDFSGP